MRAEEMSAVVDDAPTRERVATSILEHGPSTAADLARRLGLTPAAVRRHLDVLLADGVVAQRQPRATTGRGRGRPAKVFMITDAGRDTFAHAYDDLAVDALGFLAETAGDGAVVEFAARRLRGLTEKYRPLVDAAPVDERPRVLAEALSADGFAASAGTTPAGAQICQHHCPVAHVAAEFPQLCEAETAMFAELLGSHVQRLATIAHGDGVCTTHLPHPPSQATGPTTERVSS
ncbi:metalloregulator ArsR/SmtB family transcription factor [Aeromicrobium sp. 50.2.37]|uniref:helix-turn-helix transcriptional regulator n=1 Tax=Aeromicrobium sp. 50.2.37 TaxID=2969305 RepID=UPI00214FE093|nr:metalloregulator ArsR/SmtB family transcription factor [Aeromicrobium sp. 50.2.37]MCR4511906.1 transcriptional regulator [Aeromicrobium sp. 50.2.37]